MGEVIAIVVVIVGLWAVYITGIVRAARTPWSDYIAVGRHKGWTVFLVVLLGAIGALYFLIVIQREIAASSDPGAATA